MQVNIRRFLTTHSSHASHTGRRGLLSRETVLSAPSTPVHSPSYPRGPYHFYNREYFIVPFETSPEAIRCAPPLAENVDTIMIIHVLYRRALPQPLQPAPENIVLYEWINMPDSTGFGYVPPCSIIRRGLFHVFYTILLQFVRRKRCGHSLHRPQRRTSQLYSSNVRVHRRCCMAFSPTRCLPCVLSSGT